MLPALKICGFLLLATSNLGLTHLIMKSSMDVTDCFCRPMSTDFSTEA